MGKLGKAFIFLLAVMLLLTAVSRAAASFTVAQVSVENPQSRKIVHTVTGEGTVEQMKELPVYAAADVLVAEISVQPGQAVKKGDVLARLDLDSIAENIQALKDEIETLMLQNQALAAQQRKTDQMQGKAQKRAKEDYDNTILENERQSEELAQKTEEAEEALEEAKKQAQKDDDKSHKEKQKELQEAVDTAKRALDDACEEEQTKLQEAVDTAKKALEDAKETAANEILLAKRALEDASKAPDPGYDAQLLSLSIDQKQRALNDLYRRKREGEEDLEAQIRSLEDELASLRLQLQGLQSSGSRQEEAQKEARQRAQEDYNNTVIKYDRIVSEAEQSLQEAEQVLADFTENGPGDIPQSISLQKAEQALTDFLESDPEDISQVPTVKAAEQALADARQQEQALARQQEADTLQAKRALEDSAEQSAKGTTEEINRILIEEKQRQLSMLTKAKDEGGKITAQMDGTVAQVLLTVGQKTSDTAAILMSDTSGGLLFTTQVSKDEGVYVAAGDTVTLKSAGDTFEELSVLSTETNEDESVTVSVFVPKDTVPLGAHAVMELTKQSEEYSITVPLSAVHTENEKNFVFVMEPEDTVLGGQYAAQRVDITVAEKNELYAAVTESSLTSESTVIVDSDQVIAAGENVRLRED